MMKYFFLFVAGCFLFFAFLENKGLVAAKPIPRASAQTLTQSQYVKDSDYDGLSDEAENSTYHTNPLLSDTDKDGYLDSAEVLAGSDPLAFNATINGQPTESGIMPLKAAPSKIPWYLVRTAGIASYVLMFLVVALGIGMSSGLAYDLAPPVKAWNIHRYLSISLGFTLLVHVISLLFDHFVSFNLIGILIPFMSGYKPAFVGLGIISLYLLLLIMLSSLFFRLRYSFIWRFLHWAVYPMFVFSLIHGIYTGTDSRSLGMLVLYYASGLIFCVLSFYRIWQHLSGNKPLKTERASI